MSLESIAGEVSGALDIWSLGCIVVQMIMGRLPWDTCGRDELKDKLLRGKSPNIPENMSKLGKSFLKECFVIDLNKRWNASKLLCHRYLPHASLRSPTKFTMFSTAKSITVSKYFITIWF
ncbi:hypothetical protein PVK06_041961 [Gossypium arboreum]|uniref:Protein kinase domain-containing protein n=1 Tax=Gossypium arboreum TaxID=29729 RepID=A0ABR0NAK5_GOSAR|nr:hypothetical protein PVK06_041961 [Gossypium arboreum]